MEEDETIEAEPADTVWLLMGKEYRISRSIRLQWFFQHLKSVVTPKNDTEIINSTEELEVLSILPEDEDNYNGEPLCVVPTTKLPFIGRQYRFVFCIDMSPSLATIDTETGNVLIDVMFENLRNSLTGLVQPFRIPGSSLTMNPRLHVTVLAHIDVKECRVLVQGYCVNKENVKHFLCNLKRRLQYLERSIAEDISRCNEMLEEGGNNTARIKRSRTSLFYMICDGLVALQLLPDNASAGIIVVTDGVFILDNAMRTDALLTQVRASSAVCSFLQVGTGYRRASVEFGYVPHCALMQFIATTTSGAYLAHCPAVKENDDEMNYYHNALYCLNFQRDIDRYKIDSSQTWPEVDSPLPKWSDYLDCLAPYREISATTPPQHWQTMRYNQFQLKTRISSVLTVRLREGYIADGIQLTKNDTQIEVKLVWPWKEHITIEYIAKAAWPLDATNYLTYIVVCVSGPYEFLVDIAPSAKPKNHKLLRKTVLQRFDQTMKSLDMSDQLLVQLQMFPVHPYASKIPDTIAKGFPLFYMPANSNTPIVALQYHTSSKPKKSSKSPDVQFANFWKSVVTMDTSTWWNTRTWAKWWHIHRINILPKHNSPVTKGLFIPSSTHQYPHINCRYAITAFNKLMKEWCSFILLENHSYVKFMSKSGAEKPHTFCLLRLTFKGLCIGLRMAFLAGTPGEERFQVHDDLKQQLMQLTSPMKRLGFNEDNMSGSDNPGKPAESRCLIILTKQVERILVKYDSIPEEVKNCGNASAIADISISNVTFAIPETTMTQYSSALQDAQRSPGRVLSQYLFNQRWVWCTRSGENSSLDAESISRMLDAILKQRLHEGFHFWIFNKGIISLVKEVDVMVDSSEDNMSNCCVIQYVLFPPHQKSNSINNIADDSDDSEEDMQMVVEVWVEPQFGTMDVVDCPLSYINGVEYKDIPSKMFDVDAQIVTEISSYMVIHSACIKKDVTNCFPSVDAIRPTIPSDIFQSQSILRVPFLFQIVSLLQKSRLVLSVYPMMKEVFQGHLPENHTNINDVILSFINETLLSMNDCKIPLQPDDKKLIHEYIRKRCTLNKSLLTLEESELIFNENAAHDDIEFCCYVKSFGLRMIIMILPSSMKDLDILILNNTDNTLEKRSSSTLKPKNLPFFIFECEYRTIQYIPSLPPPAELDILQDYTEALSESALIPRHFNQKLPDDRSKDIAVYCQALYDHYFWALVNGVYNCLQNGYKLDPDDVESSIDLVCEETIQEIDLTQFLLTTCSHYNEMAKSNYVFSNDESLMDSFYSELGLRKMTQMLQKSNSNESRRSTKSTPRNITSVCENIPLQSEIQKQFIEIMGRYFQMVPGNSYYMYFIKDESNGESNARESLRSSNTTDSSRAESPTIIITSSEDEDSDMPVNNDETIPHKSSINRGVQRPMFLHLTCSCHYKKVEMSEECMESGNTMMPISVKTIPTCLCEITSKLNECIVDIDPCNPYLSITLTLICLTQPDEPEQDEEWTTPKKIILTRQNSADSCQSEEPDRQKKQVLTQESHDSLLGGNISNSFNSLPLYQQEAMDKVIGDVKWLLQDEIASALRLRIPLSEESLVNVATHVENSKEWNKNNNCIFEKRYFMFVTGTEKATDLCLPVFVDEVKSTMLGRYKLTRVGKYWCVVVNHSNTLESDSESREMFLELKERAKLTRKGMAHRRSQSDSKWNRGFPLQDGFDATNFNGMNGRTASLPVINFNSQSDEELVLDTNLEQKVVVTSSAAGFHPLTYGTLWQSDALPCGIGPPIMSPPIRISEYDSSRGTGSTGSLVNDDDRELRRSVSYTEEKITCETQRRSFSLSDIYRPGSSCDGMPVPIPHVHQPLTTLSLDDTSITDCAEGISTNESSEYEEELPLRPHPHFWLFMEITEESVLVYWHRRRSEQQKNIKHQREVYKTLLESLDRICKIVNQKILLDTLHSTNNCHNLLLPEDEDQVWNNRQDQSSSDIMVVKNKEFDTPFSSVIHGEYRFEQGYFECELVWEERILIHNRLRTSNRAGESSKALLAVRNILSQFRVSNRRNLFVIKESRDDRNIFYFRVNEGCNENDYTRVMSPQPDDDHYLFTPVREDFVQQSRASSISSLVNRNEDNNGEYDRYNYDRQESFQSGQYLSKVSDDKCSISETSSHIHNTQDFLQFCVYGIRDPGSEIKEDMVKLMKTKLDKTTLDIINQSLARNLKCKLSPQDVEFIQPPGQPPSRVLTLSVSNFASKYLHAMIYYLHQYLLDKYCNPRYTVPDSDFNFKNYTAMKTTEYINANDVYLYNRREKGNYGIAIAYLRLVDVHGNKVIAQPSYPSLNCMELNTGGHIDILKQLVVLKKKKSLSFEESNMCQNIFIQFSIWTCGDIDLDSFEEVLTQYTSYALYDVFLEYHLLCTPICFVPMDLQFSSDSSRRESGQRCSWGQVRAVVNSSSSSSATTPKLLKSHPTLKKFSSEPTTPSDMRRESPLQTLPCNISKDDLNLGSESPKAYSKGILGEDFDKKQNVMQDVRNSPQRKETLAVESDKKRYSFPETRQSPLPKKDNNTRENSPLNRQVSTSSKNSFHESEMLRKSSKVESPADLSSQPKTITMSELNQLKDAKDATYVMLTDAEVHESLKAVADVGNDGNQDSKLISTWQEVEMQRRLELDKRKKRRMLEHGSSGELHSNYYDCCAAIFDYMINSGNPNIHKQEGFLTHQYMLETVMKEFKKEMEDKCPDMKPKIFKLKKNNEGDVTVYVQYCGSGFGFKNEDSAFALDTSIGHGVYPSLVPDEQKHFIVIGHNAHKWHLSMGISESELSDDEEGKDSQEEQSKQKFKPYVPPSNTSTQDRRKVNDIQPPSSISSLFVPRQKFFMAFFDQKKITLYTYNYSNDVTAALDKQLKHLYAWQNVRTHLNACLFMQKFGLYHHKHFVRDCPGKEDPNVSMLASSSSTNNLLPLMKEVSSRAKEKNKQERVRLINVAEFDEVFRNTSPSKVLHNSNYFQIRDVVRRQAAQYQDVRNIKLQRASTESRLKEIFDAWKDTASQVPISEDRLQTLKKHSRLIHYCAAPILIGIGEDEEAEEHDEEQIDARKHREVKGSPHSYDESESSTMGALDWCQDVLRQYIQYLQTRGLILVQIANKGRNTVPMKGKSGSFKLSRTSNRSSDGKDTILLEEKQSTYYLQQTSMAGIILIEVFCEKNSLCYNMLAFESMQLSEVSCFVSAKDQRNFFEDCGKFKELTYIRSFTYDYHIRQLHLRLCGRRSIFPKGYPVHTLIESIIQHYPTPPRFCTCILTNGLINLPNPYSITLPQSTVYNYLVINASRYNLSKIDVSGGSFDDLECLEPSDYMLTYTTSAKYPMMPGDIWRSRREILEYDGNVALQFKPPLNSEVIEWPFFLVLVNRVEFYPRPSFVPSKRRQKIDSVETSASESEIVAQRCRLFSKHANSTGSLRHLQHSVSISQTLNNKFSPKDVSLSPETSSKNLLSHSSESEYSFSMTTLTHMSHKEVSITAQQDFLISEMKFVGEEISSVCSYLNTQVEKCLSNCLRDLVWNGLLIADTVLEDDSLSKKVKKKSSTQSLDTSSLVTCINEWKNENRMDMIPNISISQLTFNSIKLLVDLVTSYMISSIDNRISDAFSFIQPGLQQKVIKTLNAKYGPFCRQFLSDDGETTSLCIINPRNLDMIMLVIADEKEKRMEFSAVYRCEPSNNPLQRTDNESLRPRERSARNHIENVITCLCYDIWLQSLPT